jgi:hypothetical protein
MPITKRPVVPLQQALIDNLDTFVAFARKRVGDPHLAEDLVQESLLKAIKADRRPAGATIPSPGSTVSCAVPSSISIAATKRGPGPWIS